MDFGKKHINLLKEIRKKELLSGNGRPMELLKWLKGVYKERILKAIEKDYDTKRIKICFPHRFRSMSENEQNIADELIVKEFKELDINATVHYEYCEGCFLDYICNFRGFYVVLSW